MSGIVNISPDMKSGTVGKSPIGQSCKMHLTSAISGATSGYITDWSTDYNQSPEIFTPIVAGSPQGMQCNVSGMYMFVRSFYHTSNTQTGYIQNYLSKQVSSAINKSYKIYTMHHTGGIWAKGVWNYTLAIGAGDIIGQYYNVQAGNIDINSGNNGTWNLGTFLGPIASAVTDTA